jgi:hypothetical protein
LVMNAFIRPKTEQTKKYNVTAVEKKHKIRKYNNQYQHNIGIKITKLVSILVDVHQANKQNYAKAAMEETKTFRIFCVVMCAGVKKARQQ